MENLICGKGGYKNHIKSLECQKRQILKRCMAISHARREGGGLGNEELFHITTFTFDTLSHQMQNITIDINILTSMG